MRKVLNPGILGSGTKMDMPPFLAQLYQINITLEYHLFSVLSPSVNHHLALWYLQTVIHQRFVSHYIAGANFLQPKALHRFWMQ